MGCCENREIRDNDRAEIFITETEPRLEICRINVSVFCSEATSCFKTKNKSSITEFYKRLKINMLDTHISSFFSTYYQYEMNSKKLVTLGIVLCNGNHDEKVKLLFYNYTDNKKDYLTEENVRSMVTDIYDISIIELISFAKGYYHGDTVYLEKYKIELNSVYDFSRNSFISKIFDDATNNKLKFETFSRVFSYQEVNCLLEPSRLREATCRLKKTVQRAHLTLSHIVRQTEKFKILE